MELEKICLDKKTYELYTKIKYGKNIHFVKINMISNLIVRDSKLISRLAGFAILFVFFSTLPYCMAESTVKATGSQIVVETDKDTYERGDTMVISGEVKRLQIQFR